MRVLRDTTLISCGLLLTLPLARSTRQREEELVVEKKPASVPAGPGQKPFDVTRHAIPLNQIQSGGPPKNGIPALQHPAFMDASQADSFLKQEDLVLGIEFTGTAKAYPVRILNWHEVVNDDVGDQPVVVSWCPLCGSGIVYDARADGQRYTFGVSGLLYRQNLLLFDRKTESLWSQFQGRAVAGPLTGVSIRPLPATMTTWRGWKSHHPGTFVLSFDTGYKRDYSLDPYQDFPLDRRMALVISHEGQTRIYPYTELKKVHGPVQDKIGGFAVTIRFDAEQQTAAVFAQAGEPPSHFTSFLGNIRAFFPGATIFKAH